jgi:hypothetical protein
VVIRALGSWCAWCLLVLTATTLAAAPSATAPVVAPPATAHPIHSSLTEIARGADGAITLRIRVFADDFSAAASRMAGRHPSPDHVVTDSVAARYVARVVRLEHDAGTVRLSFGGQRRDAEVVWLEFRGRVAGAATKLRLVNALLFELHDDQVNVVQVRRHGASRTMLFSKGDGAKAI